MTRVEADVGDPGDLPPQTVSEDLRVFLARLKKGDDWKDGEEKSRDEVRQLVRHHLTDVEHAGSDGEEESESEKLESEVVDGERVDLLAGRVRAVVTALVEQGLIQEVACAGSPDARDVKYWRVPPVPVAPEGGRRVGRPKEPVLPAGGTVKMQDLGIMKPENEEKQSQGL